MVLLLTAGIMGIALFALTRLARRAGVRIDGKALALAELFAVAIALGIPALAPFLTEDYYVKLGALTIAAAILVTAYNAYLCRKAPRAEGEEETAGEEPEATLAERTRAAIGPEHFKWERPRKEPATEPAEDVAAVDKSTVGEEKVVEERPEPISSDASEPVSLEQPPSQRGEGRLRRGESPARQDNDEAETSAGASEKPAEGLPKIVLPGPGPAPETMEEPEAAPVVTNTTESTPQTTPPPLGEVPSVSEAERVTQSRDSLPSREESESPTSLPSPTPAGPPPPEGEASGISEPEETPETEEPPKPEQKPEVAEEPKPEPEVIEKPKVVEEPEVPSRPEELPEPAPDPMDDITAEIALLSTLDDFLDYAEAAQKQGDLTRATTAYANAVDRFVNDPYIIYLYMDLGNLLRQQARYADCINVYHAALSIPVLAENPAIAREFEKNIRYLGVVQAVLKRHHAEDTPFGDIPDAIRAEIEAADQALAKKSASKDEPSS